MIQSNVVLEDFRHGRLLKERLSRALWFAGATVDAFIRMDIKLIGKCVFVFAQVFVDAVHWTHADTSRIQAIPAKACYLPRHSSLLTLLNCLLEDVAAATR
jgi:hypothetical protein